MSPSSPSTSTLAPPHGRRGIPLLVARFRRLLNGWIAFTIAHHERQAVLAALRLLDDRELRDMGLYRGSLEDALKRPARSRLGRVPRR